MNGFPLAFTLVNAFALAVMPRRWAPLPLLVGACYITLGSGVEIGQFNFPVIRVLVAVGVVRVILRGERLAGRVNSLDWLMVGWASWALLSALFHENMTGVLVHRLGLTYNACGIYFLLRVFCQSLDDVVTMCRIAAILLVPLSIEMFSEIMTGHNLFFSWGSVDAVSQIRDGRIRAQGPFAHPILAGTVGAVSLPLMIGLWRRRRKTAAAGIVACSLIGITSASSAPILSALVGIGALFLWHWREQMRLVRWLAVLAYIGLNLVMNAPAYYLIARVDLTGSSTSWHRAALIDTTFGHLSEWWLVGTDFTRHWMPYGVGWSGDHIDITNHYLNMGVWGGLPLMVLFIAILARGFSFVGQSLRHDVNMPAASRFMIWTLGASLFSHAAAFVSVSYFDQSVVFIYVTLAAISSVWHSTGVETTEETAPGVRVPQSTAVAFSGPGVRRWSPNGSVRSHRLNSRVGACLTPHDSSDGDARTQSQRIREWKRSR